MKESINTGMTAPDFTFDSPWQESLKFYDFLGKSKVLLIFLRYMGCPLCQLKISEIIRDQDQFKKAGVEIIVALQSDPAVVRENTDKNNIPITILCDPEGKIFDLYGVYAGSFFRYITPGVVKKALKARKQGFKHGANEGKELQLPAVFLVDGDKAVQYAYYGKNVGDVPDNSTLLKALDKI